MGPKNDNEKKSECWNDINVTILWIAMTWNKNFEGRNDMSAKYPQFEMTYVEISKGQRNIELISPKVDLTKKKRMGTKFEMTLVRNIQRSKWLLGEFLKVEK